MNPSLSELNTLAIQASLAQDWLTAIDLNLHILQLDPHNISSLNRLAKAYEEEGNLEKAAKSYRKVLNIDKYNRIALNNLQRLKTLKKSPNRHTTGSSTTNFSFIEEPGKTKTVFLCKLAPHQSLSTLRTSQLVTLKANKRKISVATLDGTFVGYLPDDLSLHLIRLLKMGNLYEAAIKTASATQVEIFVRETKKSAKLKGLPSFPLKDTQRYYQFLPSEPIAEVPLEIPDSENPDEYL